MVQSKNLGKYIFKNYLLYIHELDSHNVVIIPNSLFSTYSKSNEYYIIIEHSNGPGVWDLIPNNN